jgi:hypothetical protein
MAGVETPGVVARPTTLGELLEALELIRGRYGDVPVKYLDLGEGLVGLKLKVAKVGANNRIVTRGGRAHVVFGDEFAWT